MLLPLAWLVRVDDRPQHRAWLKRLADDMEKCQDACGAIREELGEPGKGTVPPSRSNAEYGTQRGVADPSATATQWPTCSTRAISRCSACTRPLPPRGTPQYRRMADKPGRVPRADPGPQRVPSRAGRRLVSGLRLPPVGLLGLERRRGLGGVVDRGRLDPGLDSHGALPARAELNLWDLTGKSKIARHWAKCRAIDAGRGAAARPRAAEIKAAVFPENCPDAPNDLLTIAIVSRRI